MTQFNFTSEQSAEIINAASGLNYWRKQLDTTKGKVIDQIADRFFKGSRCADIKALLEANKPAKAAKTSEPEADRVPEFTSSDQHFQNAPKKETGTFIIFSVQNNAPIVAPAMATARMLASALDAELMPVACVYMVGENDEAGDLIIKTEPAPLWVGNSLVLNGDVIPTNKKPINNAKLMSGDRALTILPHPKQQAESLPRCKGQGERWALTTGTLCAPRYRVSRAGAEASADHVIGFTVIHDDGSFDQVQLNNDGFGYYRGLPINEFGFADPVGDSVIIAGDIHAEKIDFDQLDNLIELANDTAAQNIVVHDLLDFTSRNHHNRGSGLFLASQINNTVASDILAAGDILADIIERTGSSVIVVNSNHDRALDRWLEESDPRQDPVNLPLWCDLQKPRYTMALEGNRDHMIPLERALRLVCPNLDYTKVIFLDRDAAYSVHGVDLGNHGDVGINGSRGGYTAFERLGGSYVIGHSHSGYKNGRRVAVAGVTGSFDMGYNVGASSWSHSHVIVCNDGSMQIIK